MDFITRSLIPQSVLIIFFILFDAVFNSLSLSNLLIEKFYENWKASLLLIILTSIGLGFIIYFINQIYDYFNRTKFDPLFKNPKNNCYSIHYLREKVIEKLKNDKRLSILTTGCKIEELNDYELYKIIAKLVKNNKTKIYIDRANQVYTLFTTFLINFTFFTFYKFIHTYDITLVILGYIFFIFIFSLFAIFLGRRHYRQRNIILYLDYIDQN